MSIDRWGDLVDWSGYWLSRTACATIGHRWVRVQSGGAEVCARIGCRGSNRGYRVVMRGDASDLRWRTEQWIDARCDCTYTQFVDGYCTHG